MASTLNSDIKYKFLAQKIFCHRNYSYRTSSGECKTLQIMQAKSHFLSVVSQNILRGKTKKSDSNILPEAGWRRAEESETAGIYNTA